MYEKPPDEEAVPSAADVGDRLERVYERVGLTRAHAGILAMVLFGVFFDAVEQNTVGIAGPVLTVDWGLGATHIGLLNTATFTAVALGRVLAGELMDRVGRRRLLEWNLLVFAVGSLLCALAPNYSTLLAARFLVGLGLGGEIASAVVVLAEFFSARHRGTAIGLINVAAGGLGNMLAPLVGVAVFALADGEDRWRWLFGVLVVPALIVIVYRRSLPESPRYLIARGRIAEAETVFNRLASGRLRGTPPVRIAYLASLPAASARRSALGTRRPRILGRRFRRRTSALCVAVCMSYAAQFTMITLIPLILTERGMTIATALWFTLIMQSGSLAGAVTAAAVAPRVARKVTLTAGAAVGTAAGLGFGFVAVNEALILLFGAVFNFAVIVLNTTLWLFAPEQYPTSVRGFATSVILALGSLSGGLFALFAAALLEAFGVGAVFVMMAAAFAICGIAVQFPDETFDRPMPEEDTR